jgi:hypothetical protein
MLSSDQNSELLFNGSIYSLNCQEICAEYLASVQDQQVVKDTKNALVRYFIPSVEGPVPSAKKHKPIQFGEVQAAFEYLKTVSLEKLGNSPDVALERLTQLNSSAAQSERVRRNLRALVDWARERNYLPPPHNPIPQGICDHIKIGKFQDLNLKPAHARQILEEYLKQVEEHTIKTDTINAVVRFFVPGCGGPLPVHERTSDSERQASLQYLEKIPLEYLNKADAIATAVLKALGLTREHGWRIRHALRDLLNWARHEQYLPEPRSLAPWGGHLLPDALLNLEVGEKQWSAFESYQNYSQFLEESDKQVEIASLQTVVIRYFIPACGGPLPTHKRLTSTELQAGLDYLHKISHEQLQNATETVNQEFERLNISLSIRRSLRSRLKGWVNWFMKQEEPQANDKKQVVKPEFNTFYTNGVRRPRKKPGAKLYKNHCPVHALGAQQFPDDYINPYLQQQIDNYAGWRQFNDVTRGSLKTENEQILQLLGWLHRYEHVPLDKLCFESMITNCPLLFYLAAYTSREEYYYQKEVGIQKAHSQAVHDLQRVQRYLDFLGDNPGSLNRRLFIVITIAKFLYRDTLGTYEFPEARDIPVLRRLLDLQANLSRKARRTPKVLSYQETSVSWEEAIKAMEKQRQRADQIILYFKNESRPKGYQEKRRSDASLAEDLQEFLSIAFCLILPSRPRTFYELRMGTTLQEGLVKKRGFLSVEKLKAQGMWEQYKDAVKFYINHGPEDSKTGKYMPPVLLENGGWWAEITNLSFGDACLYDYIRRWLHWGRTINGEVNHDFFFRQYRGVDPIKGGAWNRRIKSIFERWTGVPVPPKNIRPMFTVQFPDYVESGALLLEHTEQMHRNTYDMRHSLEKMQPVMDANRDFIQGILDIE